MSIFRTACPTPVFCPHNIHRAIQRKIIIIKGNKKKKRKKEKGKIRPAISPKSKVTAYNRDFD